MAKPVKPTVPAPALRTDPATFNSRAESNILFFETLVDYMNNALDFSDDQAGKALAAAIAAAAGNLDDAQREAFAGALVGIADVSGNPLVPVIIDTIDKASATTAITGTDDEEYMTPLATKAVLNDRVSPDTSNPANDGKLVTQGDIAAFVNSRLPDVMATAAAAPIGSVGTYIWAQVESNLTYGDTISGASLKPAGTRNGSDIDQVTDGTVNLSGTWMLMGGNQSGTVDLMTLWRRIA